MAVKEANQENFNSLVSDGKVLVDFYATWCGPCKMLSPILERMAEERSEVAIVKINIDECPELAKSYGVMSVPTLVLFENGNVKDTKLGFMPQSEIEKWINE